MVEVMESMSQSSVSTSSSQLLSQGAIESRDVLEDWVDHILDFVGRDVDFSEYTIVADGGNGAAGAFMTRLAEKAGFRMVPLFLDPDGNFPNHHPNPMHEKNREDARQALIENQADAAFVFDGDADRVMILDDTGKVLTSGVISSVIVAELATKYPHAGYIGNATISHIFGDTVRSLGGYYEREMVGHVYIREHMMRDTGIVYAGEHSAHYFFRDNYYMDSGIMAAMVFMAALARK
jgi:phosphomannomutase